METCHSAFNDVTVNMLGPYGRNLKYPDELTGSILDQCTQKPEGEVPGQPVFFLCSLQLIVALQILSLF